MKAKLTAFMADTFTQIHIQIVFAVKYRQSLIEPSWEDRLHQYISGIVKAKGQKLLAINGVRDHVHILIGMRPTCCLSDLVREIKKSSTEMINENRLAKFHFQWQEGFGAFSYAKSSVANVINYIQRQKEHHKKKNFRQEYMELLNEFELNLEKKKLFEWHE